ncbi:MAG: hypothetical protein A3I61_01015 [Acidobacteria bacterium RIFCSPLOWO2_02_FULL_68_18]|nr:MAG: hypothetical protein A3I61_01015 [Acidobacteria bacterium RIFCSPLOWO2_02_FULL_68_18]OFW51596.1 MAG: hypothetical protein A3G77_18425 [Acidobacteria bacterium RIFCSPLOWO2_12_FULL_68_19]
MRDDFQQRCDTIEETYEFLLAYAAQGVTGDGGAGSQVREFLTRASRALADLGGVFGAVVERERLEPAARYRAYVDVLDRDARDSLAAIELVLAQPSIGSQLIDNLNASMHLRALLTDLFLIDEILKVRLQPDATVPIPPRT